MVTEVTRTTWGSRLGNSIKGILIGIVLFVGSFGLLWWNENRAVIAYQSINEMRAAAVSVDAGALVEANNDKLVHVTGRAVTDARLTDPDFGIAVNALRLRRVVEMFQWRENKKSRTEKKVGGATETITEYTYSTEWASRIIDSSDFKEPAGHQNPARMPYGDWSAVAENVTLGAFTLDAELVRSLSFFEKLLPRDPTLPRNATLDGAYIYIGENPATPKVGDTRISFQVVPQDTISVVARQSRGTLVPWTNSRGATTFRVQRGDHSLEDMMAQAQHEAEMLTWILRLAGWLVMTIGLASIFRPLSVLGDVVPFLGNLISGGIGIAAALISAVLSLVTIGIAWVFVRPVIGVPLMILAAGLLALRFLKKKPTQPSLSVSA